MTPLTHHNRTCVVGLDGVPYSLLMQLLQNSVMPNLKHIIEGSGLTLQKMRVSLPEISPVSWTSFATGSNPGVHGVFGFTDFKPHSYETFFPNSTQRRAATIWDKVGSQGGSSVVINQPFTYPAQRINGHLVSGFVAPNLEQACFPKSILPVLTRLNYAVDIDTQACRTDSELLWQELDNTLQNRIDLTNLLWNENWNYFQVVITGTDRLFHYLWTACREADHPEFARAMEYFGKIDRFVGQVYRKLEQLVGEKVTQNFFMLSDHGFCKIKKEFNLNTWLQQHDYLSFNAASPTSLNQITKESRALALDPNRIYLNTKDRFPGGHVTEKERPQLISSLIQDLESVTFEGEKVFRKVLKREEVYAGPLASKGPDLVALANHGFDVKGRLGSTEVFADTDLQGMHTWDDAFALLAKSLQPPVMIWDLADMVLDSLTTVDKYE
jgi:predicted AlkP superfamily phosphohydrolase/phosphomutase